MGGYFGVSFLHCPFGLLFPDVLYLAPQDLHPSPSTQKSYLLLYPGHFLLLPQNLLPSPEAQRIHQGTIFLRGTRLHNILHQEIRVNWEIDWQCICWLGRGGDLAGCCGFHFCGPEVGEPIPLFGFRKGSYIHLPRLRELLFIGSGKGNQLHLLTCVTLGLGWYDLLVWGWETTCLCLRNSIIFFHNNGKGLTSVPQGLYLLT